MTVSERIEQLKSEALSAVSSSASTADLEDVRVRFLGRSAELTEIKKAIGTLSPEERKEVGRSSNLASREIEAALGSRTEEVAAREQEERLQAEAVDITLPGVPSPRGQRSRLTTTTARPWGYRRDIPPAACRTPSSSMRGSLSGPIPRRSRSGRCWPRGR